MIFILLAVIWHDQRTKAWSHGGKTEGCVGWHDRTSTRIVGRRLRLFGGKRFGRVPRRCQCPFWWADTWCDDYEREGNTWSCAFGQANEKFKSKSVAAYLRYTLNLSHCDIYFEKISQLIDIPKIWVVGVWRGLCDGFM